MSQSSFTFDTAHLINASYVSFYCQLQLGIKYLIKIMNAIIKVINQIIQNMKLNLRLNILKNYAAYRSDSTSMYGGYTMIVK